MLRMVVIGLVLFLLLAAVAFGEGADDAPLPPDEAARTMVVPEGFSVTLFAGEPDVMQPIGFSMDDRGRLWVAEAYNYPHHGTTPGDRIVILEDIDGDGRHDKRTVFYDKLNYVSGIEVGFGGAWVMSPPYFYFIPDRDGDDKPDTEPQILLDGFGNHANAHNMANGFAWGPDGWLYGTHGRTNWSFVGKPGTPDSERVRFDGGVYRYHPVRHVWEPFADGTTNPWGIDWDDYGQSFVCNCVNPHLFHVIPGAHYEPWRNRKSSEFAYRRIPTIADHLHFTGTGNVREGLGSQAEDSAGGGHAHCGTMIYLGDTWPTRYRNTLFTNNIHGRRINNDILKRSGSGYVASHGPDLMRSQDQWFMGVTLAYGPDGSVYVSDWSDTGECHSVRNTRRQTGRIYRITYGTPPHSRVDIAGLPDSELVQLQTHRNEWYVRHARRVLQERAAAGENLADAHNMLRAQFAHSSDVPRQLRMLWALHVTEGLNPATLIGHLNDESEHVRAWAVQLLMESQLRGSAAAPVVISDIATIGQPSVEARDRFREMATSDPSPLVRLSLASMLQRLRLDQRWGIVQSLVRHAEDAHDPNLPLMNWYALEPLVEEDMARFVTTAMYCEMPIVRQHIARRLCELNPDSGGRETLVALLGQLPSPTSQLDVLKGMEQGLEGNRRVEMPPKWRQVYSRLRRSPNSEVQERAIRMAVVFEDQEAVQQLRELAADPSQQSDDRNQAVNALVASKVTGFAPQLLKLVTDAAVQASVIRGLAVYNEPRTADVLLEHYDDLSAELRTHAIGTLASRLSWADALLQAVEQERIAAADLSAFTARQIRNLGNEPLTKRLSAVWGEIRATPADRARQIKAYRARLSDEELSHADLSAGRAVFKKLCANCHRLFDVGREVGPDLTGAQRNNRDYILENLIDPNAQISRDYQMDVILTQSGRTITGLVKSESGAAVTVLTGNETIVLPAAEIELRKKSSVSMMPEGQLKTLTFLQVRDLIGYLGNVRQVSLPETRASER
ncbi:MAG: c-type cytochrome [Fuerstiella sp.]|nr:c-type cytochrome [Fuerstiella sp.]